MSEETQSGETAQKRRPTPKNATAADREAQALDLRKAGASFAAIAKQLGYANKGGAHKAVTRALARVPNEAAVDMRAMDRERLDRLLWRCGRTPSVGI